MLDEKLELKGYKDFTRINMSVFLDENKLKGIRRILVTMARGYIYEEAQYENLKYHEENNAGIFKMVENTREMLDAYCEALKKAGLQYLKENTKKTEKNAEKPGENKKQDFVEKIEEKIRIWNSEFATPYSTLKSPSNTIDAINFPMIISEAVQAGPLKQYVLKIKDQWWRKISYQNLDGTKPSGDRYADADYESEEEKRIRIERKLEEKRANWHKRKKKKAFDEEKERRALEEKEYRMFDDEGNPWSSDKKNNSNNAQRVMMWICSYLLGKEAAGGDPVPINYSYLRHWMQYGKKWIIKYRINGIEHDLFEENWNQKFSMNAEFIEAFDPQIVEIREGKELEKEEGYLYYKECVTEENEQKTYCLRKL